jgi:hypothetical protein
MDTYSFCIVVDVDGAGSAASSGGPFGLKPFRPLPWNQPEGSYTSTCPLDSLATLLYHVSYSIPSLAARFESEARDDPCRQMLAQSFSAMERQDWTGTRRFFVRFSRLDLAENASLFRSPAEFWMKPLERTPSSLFLVSLPRHSMCTNPHCPGENGSQERPMLVFQSRYRAQTRSPASLANIHLRTARAPSLLDMSVATAEPCRRTGVVYPNHEGKYEPSPDAELVQTTHIVSDEQGENYIRVPQW